MLQNKKRTYLLEIDSWKISGAIGGIVAKFSLFYTTQKEESLAQLHNSINEGICNIPKDLFSCHE